MRKIIFLTILLSLSMGVFAQRNIVKGRIFGLPGSPWLFTMGIGYERMLKDNMSFQVLFNRYGYDFRDTDGSAEFTNSMVPEIRFYFGRKRKETMNKAAFWGVFSELSKTEILPGGEQSENNVFLGGHRTMVSPGILIGKNVSLSEKWYVEFYAGGKYRFMVETKEYLINQNSVIKKRSSNELGVRIGFNIGIRL